jgi:hypothetical protein
MAWNKILSAPLREIGLFRPNAELGKSMFMTSLFGPTFEPVQGLMGMVYGVN